MPFPPEFFCVRMLLRDNFDVCEINSEACAFRALYKAPSHEILDKSDLKEPKNEGAIQLVD